MQNKTLFALSLARKAGCLVTGFDAVKKSVMEGKAYTVLFTSDFSEKNKMRVLRFCEGYVDAHEMTNTQLELAAVAKKPTGIFAVTDIQLANLCRNSINSGNAAQPAAIKEEHE